MPIRNVHDTVIHRVLQRPYVLSAGFDIGSRRDQTVVFVHGLGRSSTMWRSTVTQLEKSYPAARYVAIDLVGFGASPKPDWPHYDATLQARALHQTLKRRRVKGSVVLVGHSLGALVAIEFARMYPANVRHLVLVSAPLYRSEPDMLLKKFRQPLIGERLYKTLLRNVRTRQELIPKLNLYLRRAKFFDEDFVVDERNLLGVVRSIEMAIENQSAYQHVTRLTGPIDFIYGRFDPYIIKKYYRLLSRGHAERQVQAVVAGHEVTMSRRLERAIIDSVAKIL